MIRTRLTETFNIQHPIICAPMALVTGGRLAAAVSSAGGLGIVGGGYGGLLGGEPELERELSLVEGQRFGIGFITWALARAPQALDIALNHSPDCVFLSFGDPVPFAERIRHAGARLICQAQSLRHVAQAVEAGADAVVVQGTEAGGHGAGRSTMPFVPEAADYLAAKAPGTLLLAAGGIADGRGLAASLMLGADGVVVGTRFWSSQEALTPLPATARANRATGDDTMRTRAIDTLRGVAWPEEFSFRVVRNKLTEQLAQHEALADGDVQNLASAYAEARSRDDFDIAAIVAGECIGLIDDRPPAADIVKAMVIQAEALLARGATLEFLQNPVGAGKS